MLFGGEDKCAAEVIEAKAKEMGAVYHKVDRSSLKITSSSLSGTVFDYGSRGGIELKLLGLYQPKNAVAVLDAVDILSSKGYVIPADAVRQGLFAARWQARFEIISKEPLVIFDGAHNPEGIEVATNSIKHYFGDKKVCVLTGVMKDKDYLYIASRLSEIADRALVITPDNPRALCATEYASVLAERGVDAKAYGSVTEALEEGKRLAESTNTALVCLGSLYMYKEVYENI